MDEQIYSTKYLQTLTLEESEQIDSAICEKLKDSYERSGTTRHSTPVQIGEYWFKPIDAEAQEKCPELFEGKVMVESVPESSSEIPNN